MNDPDSFALSIIVSSPDPFAAAIAALIMICLLSVFVVFCLAMALRAWALKRKPNPRGDHLGTARAIIPMFILVVLGFALALVIALTIESVVSGSGSVPEVPESTAMMTGTPTSSVTTTEPRIVDESSTTTAAITTTAPATTTTTTQPTTTTTTLPSTTAPPPPSEPFVVDPANVLEPPPEPGSGGALGSGCAPGADALSDGVWAGWVISREDDRIDFDLACMHPTPEEPSITNGSSRLRSVPVSDVAVVYPIMDMGLLGEPIPYPMWRSSPTSAFCASLMMEPSLPTGCPLWLYINDGAVTEITEFWLP